MSKFVIVINCNDTDGGNFTDWVDMIYNTREEAEQGIQQAIKDELETLNGGIGEDGAEYEISEYNPFEIVSPYGDTISEYNVAEITQEQKQYNYYVRIGGTSAVYTTLTFNHRLKFDELNTIQRKIDEIKTQMLDKNCDYQTEEVIAELHKYYNFEDKEVIGSFEI